MALLTWRNLSVHLVAPILMVVDYFVFCERGKLLMKDIWWFLLFPFVYCIIATVSGFAGVTWGVDEGGRAYRFPYGFMDYDNLGYMVIPWFIGLAVLFIGLSFLLLWLDRIGSSKKNKKS